MNHYFDHEKETNENIFFGHTILEKAEFDRIKFEVRRLGETRASKDEAFMLWYEINFTIENMC